MAILAGIDEAGFGPILGPLVISSAVFSIDDSLLDADLWQLLNKSVSLKRKHIAGRLLITDSKKAYSKSLGIKHLQRTVLACLKSLGDEPHSLSQLLSRMCPDCLDRLKQYAWYEDCDNYLLSADSADLAIAASVFTDDLASNKIKLLELQSNCLDVEYYNSMVSKVKNKSSVLFTATSKLIQSAWDKFSEHNLQIIIDRQGGRVHYRKKLQRMFEGFELIILKESQTSSSYELRKGSKKMRLHFIVAADRKFLPVSLASMASKYLRQLMVDNINRYFAGFHSELKPTAGYWKDGLRFIKDLKTLIPHVAFKTSQLIRCR